MVLAALLAGCATPPPAPDASTANEVPDPTPPPVAAPPPPPKLPEAALIIHYPSDVYALTDADKAVLQAHAKRLIADPGLHLRIEAHTDDTGAADYNMELARMRSQTVVKQLRDFGVPAAQLQLMPPAKPVKPAKGTKAIKPTPDEMAASRRVDLTYR